MSKLLSQKHLDRLLIGMPYVWLLIFFLAPFGMVLKISLADPVLASPPYTPLFSEYARSTRAQQQWPLDGIGFPDPV